MFRLFSVICLLVVLIAAWIGCQTIDKTEGTAGSSVSNKAARSDTVAEQKQYQAVCISKDQHDGNEYLLTKWLDSKDKALIYGREHARKKKGHDVIYRERTKP